jgi:hypothetical protein
MRLLYFLEGIMSQKNQLVASQIKPALGHAKLIFILACLALPAVLYCVTGHPAFIVIFISGLGSISVYMARLRRKEERRIL